MAKGREGRDPMKRMFILSVLALGTIQASEARADSGPPASEASQTYPVRPRDRLERVAERFGVTIGEIISANPPRAFIRVCVGEREITLRNGETITVCRRVKYQLKAGSTLVIPTSRLLVESENVRLEAENTALVAERDQARTERDSLEEERDALVAERDRIAAEKEELLRAKQELQDSYDELAKAGAAAPAVSGGEDLDSPGQNQPVTYSREGFRIVVIVLLCGVLFLGLFVLYLRVRTRAKQSDQGPAEESRRAREDLGRIRQEREDLDATRRILTKEGQSLAERRRQVESDEQQAAEERLALDKERESIRTQRDELGRWEESLKTREAVPAPEKSRIPTEIGVPPVFPPVPTGKEKAGIQAGLLGVMVARGRQMLEEDLRTLVGREAACTAREKNVERKATALDALQAALTERERELVEKEHGVEELRKSFSGEKARCDLKDATQSQREEDLLKGFSDLAVQRERLDQDLRQREADLDRRAAEIDAQIRMYDEDIAPVIKQAREDLAAREAVLAEREKRLTEAEGDNKRRAEKISEDELAYERRLKELNDAVGTLDERTEKLTIGEQKLLDEQLELKNNREAFANEVDDAKSTLVRSKRKKTAVAALEAREAAVARREQALDDRAANLGLWEERLKDKERGLGIPDGEDTLVVPPALPPDPASGSITHVDFGPSGPEAESGGEPKSGGGPVLGISVYTCAACGKTIDTAEVEVHRAVCPKTRQHATTLTGPAVRPPAPLPETSGEDPTGSSSRCVCPQCREAFPWEEIEAHVCNTDSEAK